MDAPKVGDGVLRNAARRRRHDAVARLEVDDFAADRLDLAGAFEPDAGSGAADRAVPMARRHNEIGAVERGGAHADHHLVGFGHRLFDVADFDPSMAQYGGFHVISPNMTRQSERRVALNQTCADTRPSARRPTRLGGPNRNGRAATSAARPSAQDLRRPYGCNEAR